MGAGGGGGGGSCGQHVSPLMKKDGRLERRTTDRGGVKTEEEAPVDTDG